MSLYDASLGSFTMADDYDQKDARGFINILGLPSVVGSSVRKKAKRAPAPARAPAKEAAPKPRAEAKSRDEARRRAETKPRAARATPAPARV
jgi:hypothetical protein